MNRYVSSTCIYFLKVYIVSGTNHTMKYSPKPISSKLVVHAIHFTYIAAPTVQQAYYYCCLISYCLMSLYPSIQR